ncbi:MAG: hypothetical protein J6N15_00080, partial [Ruminiclostridium sp.]|nr:hypothetical protein [Ruminiclostridium sp.]
WSCGYTTGVQLSARYKNADGYNARERREDIAREMNLFNFLVVDEIGRRQTQWEQDALFDIADMRTGSTMLISNMELAEFSEYAGAGVIDRLNPTKCLIATDGCESWRV